MRSPGIKGPLAFSAAESGRNGRLFFSLMNFSSNELRDADRRHAEQLLRLHDDFQRILDARPLDEQGDSLRISPLWISSVICRH